MAGDVASPAGARPPAEADRRRRDLAAAAVPSGVAVAAGALGATVVVTKEGWLGLFTAVVIVPEAALVPLVPFLLGALRPVWVLVTSAPEMVLAPRTDAQRAGAT